jgi:hypothetical protein
MHPARPTTDTHRFMTRTSLPRPAAPATPRAPTTASTTPPASASPTTTTATAATAVTVTAPVGLDAATTAGPLPSAATTTATTTTTATNTTGGASALAARLAQTAGGDKTPLLALRPGVVPDAVSVTDVVKQLVDSPAVADAVAREMKNRLGVDVSPALLAAARANPERIPNLMALSPRQMRAGFVALNAAHKAKAAQAATAGGVGDGKPASTPTTHQLPQRFDTSSLSKTAIARPAAQLKELVPGKLWQGDVQNDQLDDASAKKNIAMAEMLDRLAKNATAAPGDVFVVQHAGRSYAKLDEFLQGLVADGYHVDAVVTHRVADFCALKTKAPDGRIIDVPAAALVKTGIKDKAGNEAIVPGVHSEFVFRIRSSSSTKGEKIDADVKWYQGVSGTGFFPCDVMRKSPWTGSVESSHLDQQQALRAAALGGVFADVVVDASARKGLVADGYGVTGVCNDSVAVIEQAVLGKNTAYPLLMRDGELLPEIDRRLKTADVDTQQKLRALRDAIVAVPSDDKKNATTAARALASMPWTAGNEPFASTQEARRILAGA